MKEYKTISKYAKTELIINKSRFIGYCNPVMSEDEALDFIDKIKKEHKEASHNVFAYIIGTEMNIQRFSDDKEPSGTAGLPIIELMKKENITNLVVVVTRYYGGIQLGAGGLIRAYSKSARLVLQSAGFSFKRIYTPVKIVLDYTFWGKVQNQLEKHKYTYSEPVYAERIEFQVNVKSGQLEYFLDLITDITSSDYSYEIMKDIYIDILE